jgi:hypothetical protein
MSVRLESRSVGDARDNPRGFITAESGALNGAASYAPFGDRS